ncbi:hypothetical protein ACIQPP_48440 [Streptomyces violaceusniger]|uniref:hypothetical protein n=1 Tax=Streptomyces violaceusniger TaxID=68280 RepID=UPI001F41B302|nr:hypothetical protein [Streptomyces hygroscopicus]
MSALMHATSATVFVDATTIDLVGESTVVEFKPDWTSNALVAPDPSGDGARILTGQEIGDMAVTAQLWDSEPPLVDHLDDWQDVAEVSVAWRSPYIDFSTDSEEPTPAQRLELPDPGDYRLRVHGRRRDEGDDREEDDPEEEYLIQVWPAPHGIERVIRTTSATARHWCK